jgi:hypothetical protein
MTATQQYSKTYQSFGGVDIKAVMGGKSIGDLQGVSYTVTREKAPTYVMGSVNPRSFSRGKRGIAGSLVFLIYDRSSLLAELGSNTLFWSDEAEVSERKKRIGKSAAFGEFGDIVGGAVGSSNDTTISGVVRSAAWYHDQIPPFSIVLIAENEYGHAAEMAIRGVEILNSGSGVSIDDINTDETMTFVATEIIPWTPRGYRNPQTVGNPSDNLPTPQ